MLKRVYNVNGYFIIEVLLLYIGLTGIKLMNDRLKLSNYSIVSLIIVE